MTNGVVLLFLVLTITSRLLLCHPDDAHNATEAIFEPRITGGKDAPVGRFPYMCSLRQRGSREHKCGGTLIRDRWVLTAAHCIDPKHPNSVGLTPVVYCGTHLAETNNPDLIFNAVEGYVHSSWTGDVHDGFDVGLLKLDRPSDATLPAIDTHLTPLASGDELTALGWGIAHSGEDVLQMAEKLQYINHLRCKLDLGDVFNKHMFCAGFLTEDTCRGDSGGPILIPDRPDGNITAGIPKTDLIVGMTSFGSKKCDASFPGVYMRISYMWDWIISVIDGEADHAEVHEAEPTELPSPVHPTEESLPPTGTPERTTDVSVGDEHSHGSSASGPESSTDTELLEKVIPLIKEDAAEVLEVILSEGLDPNSIHNDVSFQFGDSDDTLLHWAARFDSQECARVLIVNGAELDGVNFLMETPLHMCAWKGSSGTAKVLLAHGADVNAVEDRGHTPQHYACYYDHPKLVKILINNGAAIEAKENHDASPLHFACIVGSVNAAKILLAEGAEVDSKDVHKHTPLHDACLSGKGELVKLLLDHGADINAVDDNGHTPLHNACLNGNDEVVKVLLNKGANVNATDDAEETPLHEAAKNGHLGVAMILVKAGATKTSEDKWGMTPYDIICFHEDAYCSRSTKKSLKKLLFP